MFWDSIKRRLASRDSPALCGDYTLGTPFPIKNRLLLSKQKEAIFVA